MAKYYQKRERRPRKEWGKNSNYPCDEPILLECALEDGDTTERLIKRFLKKFKKNKLMDEIRSHEFFEKPSVINKRERERRHRLANKIRIEKELENQES